MLGATKDWLTALEQDCPTHVNKRLTARTVHSATTGTSGDLHLTPGGLAGHAINMGTPLEKQEKRK